MQKELRTAADYVTNEITETLAFEKNYILLRQKENRIFSNEDLLLLPQVSSSHPHYKEWLLRQSSANKLCKYLQKKEKPLQLLEVGCGNGWLSRQLATIPHSTVTGIDINITELQQAIAVFSQYPNLRFIAGDIRTGLLPTHSFDCVIFAASIQYFESLEAILIPALQLLKSDAEIHIIDSHFYEAAALEAARQRSNTYFRETDCPGMTNFYFHHSREELALFNYSQLYNPSSFTNRLKKNSNPFPWFCIKKQ
jgi:ubiquinone/menaquinone biosynthesis C-methylase UbiE